MNAEVFLYITNVAVFVGLSFSHYHDCQIRRFYGKPNPLAPVLFRVAVDLISGCFGFILLPIAFVLGAYKTVLERYKELGRATMEK